MRIAKPLPVRWRSENSRIGELKILLGDWDPERTAFLECQSVPDELDAGRVLLRLIIDHAAKDVRCSIPASELVIGLKCRRLRRSVGDPQDGCQGQHQGHLYRRVNLAGFAIHLVRR